MREHKEATTQEIPCVVASFFISWHRQVETPGQISRRSYRPLGQSKSQANRLGSSGSALVELDGFESTCYRICEAIFAGGDCFCEFDLLDSITLSDTEALLTQTVTPERAALSVAAPEEA